MNQEIVDAERLTTGVEGFDDVLNGGLPAERLYLFQGTPGTGKTTFALQLLLAGVVRGESCLYITLSETREELDAVAASHGWSLERITVHDLSGARGGGGGGGVGAPNTFFHPADIELNEVIALILELVERLKPTRVVFDSLSEMRLMAGEAFRYRQQILALKQFFAGRRCTVVLLDDMTATSQDGQLQSLVHGVICLEHLAPEYGADRRRLRVSKLRGSKFRGGYHDYVIHTGGVRVFPRLVAAEHPESFARRLAPSGLAELDQMMGGGLDRGTSNLFLGPAGCGKSALATQFVAAAARRGERAALFLFDETLGTFLARSEGLGFGIRAQVDAGNVTLQQVDPAELAPGEFAHAVRDAVEQRGASVVVIDSLNGYMHAMSEERYVTLHMHELLTYLNQRGVLTLLVLAQSGMMGATMSSPIDVTYLADTVLMLRFYEAQGEIRQAVSMVKRRGGAHERTIREYRITGKGLFVGEPLREFHGVLSGIPDYRGDGGGGGRSRGRGNGGGGGGDGGGGDGGGRSRG
jgi:circadian clock protein KaiC